MYCPNCGQQQLSEEMRFCSRCGLALTGLAEWLAGNRLPLMRREENYVDPASPRRRGIRRAAKLMFFSGVLFPVFFAFSIAIEHGAPMTLPFTLFFVSLVVMLYARLFSDKTAPMSHQSVQTSALGVSAPTPYLPPATTNMSTPGVGRQRVRTNELAQPPGSVTDHTTRLLDNE